MHSDKQLQVIEAAYGVFFRYGFARTTMGDLAKAAGMSRPALYLVYPGKEEVFEAVVDWMSENMLASIRATLKADWPLERKLMHVFEVSNVKPYEEIKANPDAQDMLALDGQMPALHRVYARFQACVSELLEDAVKQSELKASAVDVARVLMASMRGFKLAAVDGKDLRRLMALQIALTTAGLGRKEAAAGAAPAPRAPSGRRSRAAA